MSACKRTRGCLMHEGHAYRRGSLRDLVVEGSAYVANWAAAKILRALGHEVKR